MPNRKNDAYTYLYNQIVSYKLKPGIPIKEVELAEELQISRTPIREALTRLEADGLVTKRNGRSFCVATVSEKDVRDIYFLRRVLEVAALRASFPTITREDLLGFQERLAKLGDNVLEEEEAYNDVDSDLHDLFVWHSGNDLLISTIDSLNARVDRFRRVAPFNTARPLQSRQEHLQIVQTLLDGDLERACALLDEHIINVEENIIKVYRDWF